MLNKSQDFFKKARPRALQSWLSHIQVGVKTVQETPFSKIDIHNWVQCHPRPSPHPPSTTVNNTDSDSVDSDATAEWITHYPDEDPHLDTWNRFHSKPVTTQPSPKHISKNTSCTSILQFFHPSTK